MWFDGCSNYDGPLHRVDLWTSSCIGLNATCIANTPIGRSQVSQRACMIKQCADWPMSTMGRKQPFTARCCQTNAK